MQAGRSHRTSIHIANFREIGAGVTIGSNASVSSQLVTQDFGTRPSSPSFGTSVAFYDLNANDFYDVGEGISGLTVNVSGTSNYCTTAVGGGWVVPVPSSAAIRTVNFSKPFYIEGESRLAAAFRWRCLAKRNRHTVCSQFGTDHIFDRQGREIGGN